MELTVGDRRVRPLTADEVMRMVEAGILGYDEPVELLHGVLVKVSAKTPAHEAVKLIKPGLYAQAGVPEYWVVDVEARRLRIFSDPSGDHYASQRVIAGADAVVQPSHFEASPISLEELFSGL
jgi:hypothetical protein